MAGTARMKKVDLPMMAKPEEMKSTISVNLKKFKELNEYDVDDSCRLVLTGKVTRVSKDEYGHSMSIEIDDMDCMEDEEKEEDEE